MWSKARSGGKAGFDKVYGWVDKLGAPVNKLSNKVGAEAFWPTTLDKESDKAARILRSFCKDGFYQEEIKDTPDGVKEKQRVMVKIPTQVIRNAKGLAIFTVMRTGLWFSGAGGAGIIIARLPDGSWSPPSGLMLHTAGMGLLAGADIYDCVMVINTEEALQGFSKLRATVGGELGVVAGPIGIGGVIESEVHTRRAPIFTYMKSRGLYGGIQVDGTVLIERTDENEKFYGEKLSVMEILTGKVRHPPASLQPLWNTLKAAQGLSIADSELPQAPPPSDMEIIDEGHQFGVPDKMDPDPYGVLALEKEGLQVKEAGTNKRASHEAFLFSPSPSSPVFQAYQRSSIDGRNSSSRRSSWRTSVATTAMQSRPLSSNFVSTDSATQTEFDTPATSPTSMGSIGNRKMAEIKEDTLLDAKPSSAPPALPPRSSLEESQSPASDQASSKATGTDTADQKVVIPKPTDSDEENDSDNEAGVEAEDEEPAVVQTAATPQSITRARLVSVKKASAPSLPPRNPGRGRKTWIGAVGSGSEADGASITTERTKSNDSRTSSMYEDAEKDAANGSPSRKGRVDSGSHAAAEEELLSTPTPAVRSPSPSIRVEGPPSPTKVVPGAF